MRIGTRSQRPPSALRHAALTVDRASRWRAAEMAGMLLRGTGHTFAMGATRRGRTGLRARLEAAAPGADPAEMALVRLRPDRVVWWEGWTSGTIRATRSSTA